MNAQEYRALVNKLELLEDETSDSQAAGTAPPATAQPAATTASATIEDQIKHAPTFNQAYAMAKKAGLKKFKWCQCKDYMVKDAPPAKQPYAMPGTQASNPNNTFVTTNPMGDSDPTQFSGNPAQRGR
jgi:hypothetical protein